MPIWQILTFQWEEFITQTISTGVKLTLPRLLTRMLLFQHNHSQQITQHALTAKRRMLAQLRWTIATLLAATRATATTAVLALYALLVLMHTAAPKLVASALTTFPFPPRPLLGLIPACARREDIYLQSMETHAKHVRLTFTRTCQEISRARNVS